MAFLQILMRLLLSILFVGAGVAHFVSPGGFLKIVPPQLPAPLFLVYLSGLFEVLGGVGIQLASTREVAGWGLILLLIAVFPANIYMAVAGIKIGGFPSEPWMAWARLPLQFVLIGLVLWSCELLKA